MLILIFSSILATQALQPNTFFEFYNKTKSANFTKITYRLNTYEGSSVPLDINKHFDILFEYKITKNDSKIYEETISFKSKDDDELVQKPLVNKFRSFNFSLFFMITDIIEKILKCNLDKRDVTGKFYIVNSLNDDQNLKVNGDVIISEFDNYFDLIYDEKIPFCDARKNFKFIFIISGFSIIFSFMILLEFLKFLFDKLNNRSSRVHVFRSDSFELV